MENGRVWLPARNSTTPKPFADDFREACAQFPNNIEATRDLVDTFTQAIEWLNRNNWIYTKDDVTQDPQFFEPSYDDEDRFKPYYEG